MATLAEIFVAVALMATVALLATGRGSASVRWVGLQGAAVSTFPIFVHHDSLTVGVFVFLGINLLLKGVVFTWLLLRICRTRGERERPHLGFSGSVLAGLGALVVALWLGSLIGAEIGHHSEFLFVTSFFLIFSGLLLIVTRRQAVLQVVGYLTLENGIFVFGSAVVLWTPLLVELGVLLDVFVFVLVVGIAIDRIRLEIESTDVTELNELRE